MALVVLVAAARTAVGDGGSGNGGGGGQATEEDQVLRLWSSAAARGREAEDEDRFFKWEWEDDEDEDVVDEDEDDGEEEDHVMAVQGRGACRNVVNVDSFGAAGDGDSDDTQVRADRPIISAFRFHTVALHHACMRTVNIIFIWSVTLHSNTLLPKRFHHLLGF